jgi:hypothetical protein
MSSGSPGTETTWTSGKLGAVSLKGIALPVEVYEALPI